MKELDTYNHWHEASKESPLTDGGSQVSNPSEGLAVCPFCMSEIPIIAKKCRHCGEWVNKKTERDDVVRGSDQISHEEVVTKNVNGEDASYPQAKRLRSSDSVSGNHSVSRRSGKFKYLILLAIVLVILTVSVTVVLFVKRPSGNGFAGYEFGMRMEEFEAKHPSIARVAIVDWNDMARLDGNSEFATQNAVKKCDCYYYKTEEGFGFANNRYICRLAFESGDNNGLVQIVLNANQPVNPKQAYITAKNELVSRYGKPNQSNDEKLLSENNPMRLYDCSWDYKVMKITLEYRAFGDSVNTVVIKFVSNKRLGCHNL